MPPEDTASAPGQQAVFAQPLAEQVAFFRGKLGRLVPTQAWTDMQKGAHDRAFMVAGAQGAELLADLAAAVDAAIAQGEGIAAFRVRFGEIITRHGWAGFTGDDRDALGRGGAALGWRTRVIYTTNMRTSYAAGRLAQLRDSGLTFWVYRHGASAEPRAQHLAWDGLTLPADHPFWLTHYPPNAWGCSCFVVGAASLESARDRGGRPEMGLPAGWDGLDARTGEPPGIDKGWGYAPGATVADQVRTLATKLDRLPPQPCVDLIQYWLKADAFARWHDAPEGSWPLVRLGDAHAQALGAQDGVRVAHLSEATMAKQRRQHPELSPGDYVQAQEVVDRPTHTVQEGASMIFVREVPDEAGGAGGGHVLVVKATRSGQALFVTSMRRLSRQEAQRDAEIRRLLNKGKTG